MLISIMANEKDLENLIEKKFMTQQRFSKDIEQLVHNEKDFNYIDAVVFYCEENEIEIEKVSKLISKPLKEKLRCEALDLNFLKKTSRAKLPL
ncbi:late promoter transcription accessory protein [Synechococcus phage S-BM3]|nr:late promoter transcription accessory protein [Synechococcus phage S-BM3]